MKHKLTEDGKNRLSDFVKFGRRMLSSKDIDPLYPVLSYLQKDMDESAKLWHSFLYVAWYNLPSATIAFDKHPDPAEGWRLIGDIEAKWATGVERRANRGGKVASHISSFLDDVQFHKGANDPCGILGWHQEDLTSKDSDKWPEINWGILNKRIQGIYLNGRWAAYKHLEVLRRVNGMNLRAPDMGNQFSSGPREGLAMFYGELEGQGPAVIEILDEQGLDLQQRVASRGLEVDIEELETLLCNWKSLMKSKYYVGHDIDEFQEQIEKSYHAGHLSESQRSCLYEAREESLPNQYLGELGGWEGVQKKRMRAYSERGKILIRKSKVEE